MVLRWWALGPGNNVCLCVQGRQKTAYLQHRTSTHTHAMIASNVCVCVSVFKSCKGVWKKKGVGGLGRVAADVKIHVESLLPMASFFSLIRAVSLLLIVVCDVIVDIFWKVVYLCLNLAVWWIDVVIVFFFSVLVSFFCIFCTRGKEPNVTNTIPISWRGLNKGNAIYSCVSEKKLLWVWRCVSLLDNQLKQVKSSSLTILTHAKASIIICLFRYHRLYSHLYFYIGF